MSARLDGGQRTGHDIILGWPEVSASHPDVTKQRKDSKTASLLLACAQLRRVGKNDADRKTHDIYAI